MKHCKYTCNFCGGEITRERPGWPVKWMGPGACRPEKGATLEIAPNWMDAPKHICEVCVLAVRNFISVDTALFPPDDAPARGDI